VTKGDDHITIRPLTPADRAQWAQLWCDYLAFYETTLPDTIYDTHFARLTTDTAANFHGLVAESGGTLVGLVHYVFHPHGWKVENVCYLQDLFVTPATRGTGTGRALIEAVYAAADAAGSPSVYWLTQTGNAAGRRLYDKTATLTDFIKYQRPL